jgi:hypothetical protein
VTGLDAGLRESQALARFLHFCLAVDVLHGAKAGDLSTHDVVEFGAAKLNRLSLQAVHGEQHHRRAFQLIRCRLVVADLRIGGSRAILLQDLVQFFVGVGGGNPRSEKGVCGKENGKTIHGAFLVTRGRIIRRVPIAAPVRLGSIG